MRDEEPAVFRRWARVGFVYFIIAAALGSLLRYVFIEPIPGVNYSNFLHAHSHVAFLGWIFNALYAAIVADFVPRSLSQKNKYKVLFILFQVSVAGMLITFPLKGYYRDSIIFSTLHIVFSYVFAAWIFMDGKNMHTGLSYSFIKVSLVFMIISSFGPFALGPIISSGMGDTPWYHLAIYYYLHFQYNGWFIFALLGLFFKTIERAGISYDKRLAGYFFWLMTISCIPAYALSTLWAQPPAGVYALAWAAAVMQLTALALFSILLWRARRAIRRYFPSIVTYFFLLAFAAFVVKNFLQFFSAFDAAVELAYQTRNFVIAYLHVVFIGVCSFFLIGFYFYKKWATNTTLQRTGAWIFAGAFILSELILVLYPALLMLWGTIMPGYNWIIFIISITMTIGLLLIFLRSKNKKLNFI